MTKDNAQAGMELLGSTMMAKGQAGLAIAEERIARAKQEGHSTLVLAGLGLTTLPESLGQLTRLVVLYLDENQLRTLPESLLKLKNLQALFLHGNDNLGIPAEVLGPTWREVIQGRNPANAADMIEPWHDRKIEAGDEWKRQIHEHLQRADIFLLLVSADSLRSDYCWEKEMQMAMERHRQGAVRVIPVIVRDCVWQKPPLDELEAVPTDGHAVNSRHWRNQDQAWRIVIERIEKAAEEIRKRQRERS